MITTIISSIFEVLGIGVFMYYLIRGLNLRIKSLEEVSKIQNKTLEVMERRIEETEKIGGIYKMLITDLPNDIENYKTIVSMTKDATILELKNENTITKQKLLEAEEKIEKSGDSAQTIKQHLLVLKKLVSPNDEDYGTRGLYIKRICEYSIELEEAVKYIVNSRNINMLIAKLGLSCKLIETNDEFDTIMSSVKSRILPDGTPVENYVAAITNHGNYAIVNNRIFIDKSMMIKLQNEFSEIKAD